MGPQAVAFIAVTVELPEPDVWKTDCHRRPETGVKAGEWLLGGTAMSKSYIPPEILDYTVDLLHDEPEPLEECCLVSKSWIPCTRKHLFAEVRFHSEEDVELWKKTFPDPSTSPGCYTRTLSVSVGTARFRATDAGAGGWVGGFSRVVCLVLHGQVVDINRLRFSLVPLHGFSPALKSIRMDGVILPSSQIFGLVLSFPILDDLVVIAYDTLIGDDDGSDELPAIIQPSSLPKFAGSLDIPRRAGVRPILRWLLSLPGNIHFRKLTLVWSCEEDISLTTALVERCSHTLESLKITCTPFGVYTRSTYVSPQTISISSRAGSSFDRPLEGGRNQKCSLWGPEVAEGRLDHYDPPNHHTQTSRLSRNLDLPGIRPIFNPPRHLHQGQANNWRAILRAVVGI